MRKFRYARLGPSGFWVAMLVAAAVLCCSSLAAAKKEKEAAGPQVMIRARVTKLKPDQPARIHWRWGGEGLGGDVVRGELTAMKPDMPKAGVQPFGEGEEEDDLLLEEDKGPKDRIIVPGEAYDYHYLNPGMWGWPLPLSTFKRTRGRLFVTFTLTGHKTQGRITDAELELEFLYGKRSLKRFTVAGPDGPTFGVIIPFYRLGKNGEPTPEFIEEARSLRQYVESKAKLLEAEPWAQRPVPKLYGFVTDCHGYRPGSGYGCRTTDRETMLAEYGVLRLMGLNGLRGYPAFVGEMMRKKEGIAPHFSRVKFSHLMGYPIPTVHRADGRPPGRTPGDGCPYLEKNIEGIRERVKARVEQFMQASRELPVHEIWGLTVDEIGTVFDGAPEGKAHMGCCPHCREAFREMIRKDGRTPEDFGAKEWEPIRATYGYWAKTYWESERVLTEAYEKAKKEMEGEVWKGLDTEGEGGGEAEGIVDELKTGKKAGAKKDSAKELLEARQGLEALVWKSRILYVEPEDQKLGVSKEGWNLLVYYSRRFNCESAAQLFTPLKDALDAENEKKRQALARGETDTPEAKQPWVYSYALRGNTFLMGGHSLDFFNFYRHADNAFMYETSNRDGRVWQWDSYLCDVGRTLNLKMGKRFGVYVKPHRGAPVQRALSAIARGARVIYWYTYGPDWAKGDTFGGRIEVLKKIGWFARLVGQAEEVTYESHWAVPPQVIIVRPRTAEFFSGSASWEGGKWVYTALMHSHIPVDAFDEALLLSEDLSRYKVIVICGSHLRRDVGEKLKGWVEAGGTLFTCGWGMARDEAQQPLDMMLPVFGLESRGEMEVWGTVPRYGATRLGAVRKKADPPAGAQVRGQGELKGSFMPAVGREVLRPAAGTDVLATYADGGAAMTRHKFGKGTAYVAGFYAGVEYALETMQRKEFDPQKRAFIAAPVLAAGVRPVVDADVPLVEGVLLKNDKTGALAVMLMNWKFKIDEEVTVTVRGTGPVRTARSLALDQPLAVTQKDDAIQFVLPRLDDGEIVLLDPQK